MSEQIRQNNIERFTGFSDLYDQNRPKAPVDLIDILTMYLERRPEVVADVGCGTGLSSFIWLERANQIVGIEPNDDMRAVAINRWKEVGKPQQLEFVNCLWKPPPLIWLRAHNPFTGWTRNQHCRNSPGYCVLEAFLLHTIAIGHRLSCPSLSKLT